MRELNLSENVSLNWLGHASFLIRYAEKNVFIDPFQINTKEKADIIFITHHHYDHYSVTDLKKIIDKDTILVIPENCTDKLKENPLNIPEENIIIVNLGFKGEIKSIGVETVPSYNIDKKFHEKSNEWIGYILNFNGIKVYHAGDTDVIPEMKDINCDVALLPVGGTYTMDANEAAKACDLINPKMFAIPMHYNSIVGTREAAEEFEKLSSCKVEILD
ncbi:Zn-dependent hydrolase [Candidatus Woesearchaeota archaeon]|nr:MAG: Zn-dependent hydrolase [Candidatus Woesearchaeota archaeon]